MAVMFVRTQINKILYSEEFSQSIVYYSDVLLCI